MEKKRDLTPDAALEEIDRMDDRVHAASARWEGGWLVIIGIATITLYLVIAFGELHTAMWVWLGFSVLVVLFARSRGVEVGRVLDLRQPVGAAYVVLTPVAFVIVDILPAGLGPWPGLIGLLPAAPCFYGAWQLFRR